MVMYLNKNKYEELISIYLFTVEKVSMPLALIHGIAPFGGSILKYTAYNCLSISDINWEDLFFSLLHADFFSCAMFL